MPKPFAKSTDQFKKVGYPCFPSQKWRKVLVSLGHKKTIKKNRHANQEKKKQNSLSLSLDSRLEKDEEENGELQAVDCGQTHSKRRLSNVVGSSKSRWGCRTLRYKHEVLQKGLRRASFRCGLVWKFIEFR